MGSTPCRTSWDFACAEKSFILTNAHDHLAPNPAERFATTLQCLTKAVLAMMGGERLPLALISLIVDRIRRIKQRFAYPAAASAPVVTPRKTAAHRRDDAPNSRRTHRA